MFVEPRWRQFVARREAAADMNKFVDRSKSKTFFIDEVETPKAKLKEFA